MAEFLLELFSEEIPARMQVRAAEELQRLIETALREAGLRWTHSEAHVTPRRLALVVDGLPHVQPNVVDERKGPREDAPPAALEGFVKSTGLRRDQLELRDTPKGRTWFAVFHYLGRPTEAVLVDILRQVIPALAWPKSMRWGEVQFRWVRPLHHVLAIFDGKALVGTIEPALHTRFVPSGLARGHRFLALDAFAVHDFAEYKSKLLGAYVMLDRAERKATIVAEAQRLAAAEGLTVRQDPELVEEVVGLVEWPVVLIGRIGDDFMTLPGEVLTSSMRAHQKYFACLNPDGTLAPRFIIVANTLTRDGGREVVAGNERVLRARLSDARFFWDQDRKTRLEDRVPVLKNIIFHAKLGSMEDKVVRLQALAADLAPRIPGADVNKVRSAALLAKADLVTGMVGEFPDLQGIMGRYYALEEGEDPAVADAIAEHYKPQGPSDRCPTAPVSVAVALADKIDTLVGFFGIGERPSGSRDPYALRRAALGVIRIIVENRLRLSLLKAFDLAVGQFKPLMVEASLRRLERLPVQPDFADVQHDLLPFFIDRLKVALREEGVRYDLIDAVFSLGGEDDLVRLLARVEALGKFLGSEDGANLLTAYRRAANIVRIESKRDGITEYPAVERARFVAPEEDLLWQNLLAVRERLQMLLKHEEFAEAMQTLASLRPVVDGFFDRVTVNAEVPALRLNRLALLQNITRVMNRVADFSKIEG